MGAEPTFGGSYSDDRTLDPETGVAGRTKEGARQLALVIAWCTDAPWRVGELALVPNDGRPRVLGRGGPDGAERLARLAFVRQRPAFDEATAPLTNRRISRAQLRVRSKDDHLVVQNVGRCPLRVRGRRLDEITIGEGDTLELEDQLLFLCTSRPNMLAPLQHAAGTSHPFGEPDVHGIVGESVAAWRLRDHIAFVAPRPGHVLVCGPSGTGKELVARALHAASSRARRSLVARNAATIPAGLIDAELFGHVRNYPNPGMPERRGLVGEADGSTLFLDEIGELPHELQAHLLRLLDSGEYQRLGDTEICRADLRVVGATNRSPSELKADLSARFRHLIAVPSLCERREDIPLLVRHLLTAALRDDPALADRFLTRKADGAFHPRMSSRLIEALLHHPLPLEVRELDSILWRCLGSSSEIIDLDHPPENEGPESAQRVHPQALSPEEIQACLDRHGGVQEKAWKELGLESRYVLRRLIRKHGLKTGSEG